LWKLPILQESANHGHLSPKPATAEQAPKRLVRSTRTHAN
jgi:hypothetical protein